MTQKTELQDQACMMLTKKDVNQVRFSDAVQDQVKRM